MALTVIVLGYLVPHLVRHRDVMVESRVTDRFSAQMRLVTPETPSQPVAYRADARPLVHNPEVSRRRTEALAMIRPTTPVAHRVNARELATARAARAAEISRRAAAARRRLTVAVALVLVTVGLVVGVAAGGLHWLSVLPSTLLLGAVAYTGRKAALVAARLDAKAWAEITRLDERLRMFRSDPPPAVEAPPSIVPESSPAVAEGADAVADAVADAGEAAPVASQPPESFEQIVAGYQGRHVASRELEDEPPRHARTASLVESAETWTPVPVPLPTYTLKQEVPRRDVEPYADATGDDVDRVPLRPTSAAPASAAEPVAPAFDLGSVLARRRAAGA